jgi:excisionase family DNA binding protein
MVIIPRVLWIPDAANYIGATNWRVETMVRENEILSYMEGKRRVIDRLELDKYVDRRNKEAAVAAAAQLPIAGRPVDVAA